MKNSLEDLAERMLAKTSTGFQPHPDLKGYSGFTCPKSGGKSYLTLQVGKHRGVPVINEAKKYIVLPFPPVGPIPDDVDKDRIDVKKVG